MTVEHDQHNQAFQRFLPGEFQPKFKVPNGTRTIWAVDQTKAERPIEMLLQEVYPNLGDDYAASLKLLHENDIKTVGDLRKYDPDASSISKLGPVVRLIHQARAEIFLSEGYTRDVVGEASVDNLALSARITNLLHRYGVHTKQQLAAELPNVQSNIRGIGPKLEARIREALQNPPSTPVKEGKVVATGKEVKSRSPIITRLNLLATGIERVMGETPREVEPFGLKQACKILRAIGQQAGNPSTYPYLLIVDSWIKTAVILGNWPSSPGKIRVTESDRWQYRLTLPDLRDVLRTTAKTLQETGLSQHAAAHRAYKTFAEKRKKGVPVEDLLAEVATALDPEKPLSKAGKKTLIAKMQRDDLPEDIQLLARNAFIFGVSPENRQAFIDAWKTVLKEDRQPSVDFMMKNWPTLSKKLRAITHETVNPRRVSDLSAWLLEQGIPVVTITREYKGSTPTMHYYLLPPEAHEKLVYFLADEANLARLRLILHPKVADS